MIEGICCFFILYEYAKNAIIRSLTLFGSSCHSIILARICGLRYIWLFHTMRLLLWHRIFVQCSDRKKKK